MMNSQKISLKSIATPLALTSALILANCDEFNFSTNNTTTPQEITGESASGTESSTQSVPKITLTEERARVLLESPIPTGTGVGTTAETAAVDMRQSCIAYLDSYETLKSALMSNPAFKRYADAPGRFSSREGAGVWYVRTPEGISYNASNLAQPYGTTCLMVFSTYDDQAEVLHAFESYTKSDKLKSLSVNALRPNEGQGKPAIYAIFATGG